MIRDLRVLTLGIRTRDKLVSKSKSRDVIRRPTTQRLSAS